MQTPTVRVKEYAIIEEESRIAAGSSFVTTTKLTPIPRSVSD